MLRLQLSRRINLSWVRICTKNQRCFSDTISKSNNNQEATKVLVYTGPFESKIRMLRRFTLISSLLSVTGLPALMATTGSTISLMGQIGISFTAIVASISSTYLIHVFSQPYVTSIYRLPAESVTSSDPKQESPIDLEVTRLNMIGIRTTSVFSTKDIEFVKAVQHPFATFKIKKSGYYYVDESSFTDPNLKKRLMNHNR